MPDARSWRDRVKALGLVDGVLGFVSGLIMIALLMLALRFLPRFTGV